MQLNTAPSAAPAAAIGPTPQPEAVPSRHGHGDAIRLSKVSKWLGGHLILDEVDLCVSRGEVVGVCGPSGAGKSTLLRTINYLLPIDGGEIEVDGCCLPPRRGSDLRSVRARVGMVFQQFNLYPHLTAAQNVSLAPRKVRGLTRDAATDLAHTLLEQVGLGNRADAVPAQLSGGEQQRVAIARALAMEPCVLLLDEPTAALDMERKAEVLDVIGDLSRSGRTVVLVSHELRFAEEIADRLVFMDVGRVVETDIPSRLLHDPAEERTRCFMQRLRY
ncbi:MAG: amino acid ABC transporter ATP-binding protein [Ectothiorhodospiraceae bacterium]|jgi:ABC-type polar amino acid transport system ATPase subunit